MDIILIPGFWLDGSSWAEVTSALDQASHRVRALTLPGLESADADRGGIGLRDHVDAVVDEVDGPVVLVGHSGGGAIAHAVADARPERVARVVYVDAGPLGDGQAINDELPVVGGEIPLPDWSEFGEEDLRDLDEELREAFRARAVPQPAAVASDPQVLTDERRYDVPATIIACEFSSDQVREWIAQGHPYVAELAAMRDVEYIDLPTGHWPQFTKPSSWARRSWRRLIGAERGERAERGRPEPQLNASERDDGLSVIDWLSANGPRENRPRPMGSAGGEERASIATAAGGATTIGGCGGSVDLGRSTSISCRLVRCPPASRRISR